MQYDFAVELLKRTFRNLAAVNSIVVKDYMNYRIITRALHEFLQQPDKQSTGFPFTFHPDQTTGCRIHSAGHITFDDLAGRNNLFLLSAFQGIAPVVG